MTKSILHVNSYYQTSGLHKKLVEQIEKSGEFKQHVYVPIQKGEEIKPHVINDVDEIKIEFAQCFSSIDRKIWPLKMYKVWKDFKKRFSPNNFQIVHAHTLIVNGYLAYKYYKLTGTPYVVTVRNTDANKFLMRTPFMKKFAKPILQNANQIIFLGPAFWQNNFRRVYDSKYLESISAKVRFVPNGINEYWYDNIVTELKPQINSFNILYVGDLTKNKNVATLLEAVEILKLKHSDVIVNIVGNGTEEESLKQVNCSFPVHFHGRIRNIEILKKMYRNADVLAVPSRTESFGLVFAEALSQGTPILYTKGQGFDGIFEEGKVGCSIEAEDVQDIADKLDYIKNNDILLQKNILKIGDRFSWRKIASSLIEIYNKHSK